MNQTEPAPDGGGDQGSGPGHDPGPAPSRHTPGERVPDPVRDPWLTPMRIALGEAVRARETGDVPVGALVLGPGGAVLGRGRNEREATGDPTAHAEVLAIREAARAVGSWRLHGCTLLVTLEPCTMCAGASVLARLARVVYGATDPKAGAAGSLWDVVRDRRLNHRPEVVHGVLAAECGRLLTDFFRRATPESRPDTDFGAGPPVG
ncbi:tRNA adenosine(34) deaminase TadA [Streptomyces sp. N2-109]|uniref:tRNA-specific adenosine deaminase n=1 Tax=Streptomyces gossypii TaxID=2883101 RepID=A0ABT2JNE1_9ACTN|nr:tRNA adenosine(34) deaminase TadA [Streptomyces gossypii]MCT2589394.1 tRNA adenosine(34) deaminase TadA [Streptomyces gossypii]